MHASGAASLYAIAVDAAVFPPRSHVLYCRLSWTLTLPALVLPPDIPTLASARAPPPTPIVGWFGWTGKRWRGGDQRGLSLSGQHGWIYVPSSKVVPTYGTAAPAAQVFLGHRSSWWPADFYLFQIQSWLSVHLWWTLKKWKLFWKNKHLAAFHSYFNLPAACFLSYVSSSIARIQSFNHASNLSTPKSRGGGGSLKKEIKRNQNTVWNSHF